MNFFMVFLTNRNM